MKKIYTLAAALIVLSTNAQIQISHKTGGATVPNNGVIYLDSYADSTTHYDLNLKNVGTSAAVVNVKRTIETIHTSGSETAETYFCTGIDCYTPEVFSASLTIMPNEDVAFIQYLKEIGTKGETVVYYRLTSGSTDITYYFKYNNLLGVTENSPAALRTLVLPNPASADARLMVDADRSSEAAVTVTDIRGAILWSNATVELHSGINYVELPADRLSSGIYFVQVTANGEQNNQKLIITK